MRNIKESEKIYYYIAANLAFLIPVPGRFAYALLLMILFNIQMALITLLFHAIHRMSLANMRNALLALAIIALGVGYKQLLALFCPIASLTLGFCIFLPTLASVIIEFFFLDYEHGLKAHIASNMKKSGFMSIFSLLFFLIRDIFGYGTITLPQWKKILVIHLPYNAQSTQASLFLATIPGSLALMAVILAFYIFVTKRLRIASFSPQNNLDSKNSSSGDNV